MAIHLNVKNSTKTENGENAKLHWMPCVIKIDGEAKVSTYFEPIIVNDSNDILKSSFRGYPLLGKKIEVPKNYTGIVLRENRTKLNEEAERNFYKTHSFDKFTYWNWDAEPSVNDKFISALEWIDIAEALHTPVDS